MAKYIRTFIIIILVSAVLCTAAACVGLFSQRRLNDSFNKNDFSSIDNSWTLTDEKNLISTTVSLPLKGNDIQVNGIGSQYRISHILPDFIRESWVLMVPVYESRIIITIDDEEMLDFRGTEGFPKNALPTFCYLTVPLSSSDASKEVAISVISQTDEPSGIGVPMVGERNDILLTTSIKRLPRIIAGLLLIVFGIFAFLLEFFSRKAKARTYGYIYSELGAFAMLLGIWEFLQSGLIQLFTGNLAGMDALSHICLMLIPLPVLWHFFFLSGERYKNVALLSTIAVLSIDTVLLILVFGFNFDFSRFDLVIRTMLVLTTIYAIATVTLSHLRSSKRTSEYALIIAADLVLATGGLSQLVMNLFELETSGTLLLISSLIFLILIVSWSRKKSTEEEKSRKTAIKKAITKSSFLANTSHEIRTPINSIISLTAMMKRDNSEENLAHCIDDMNSSSLELKELVNKILVSARIDSGKEILIENDYSTIDFTEYIRRSMDSMQKKDVTSVLNVSPTLPRSLFGDAKKALAASISIIENAFKYTEKGAIIVSIYSEETDEPKKVRIFVNVHDTGRGITKEQEAELYQQFNTNYSEAQGAGLGLYIAGRYSKMLDGEITCERLGDLGTIFIASFIQKLSDKEVESEYEKEKKKAEAPPKELGPMSVLTVDDVPINLAFAEMVVKGTGNTASIAISGEEAIKAAREKKFDLILMDAQMPQMDGFETLHKIRSDPEGKNHETTAYLLTADEGHEVDEKALSEGFAGCASKPLTKDALIKMLSAEAGKEGS